MANVIFENITKKFDDVTAVDDFSLEVKDKEFLVLLGPSGCGKTTTMRVVAGLEQANSGKVLIDNNDVTDYAPKERDIAMVFQSYALYPHMTVFQNIEYPLKIKNVPKDKRNDQVNETIKKVQLEGLLHRLPKQLSGGQRQRVALARAIIRNPKVFLMDEPLSNLDAKLRVEMRAKLKNLQNELGITTIYVTHDQVEAMTLADRVVVMNNAKISQVSSPSEIYNNPSNLFVAGFVGSPPMNFIHGEIKNNKFINNYIGEESIQIKDRGSVILGVRPEDMNVAQDGNIKGEVYSFELTGDSTYVTVKLGDDLIIAKTESDYKTSIGSPIALSLNKNKIYFFDSKSEDRIIE